jgi:hypothetical protein
MSGRTSFLVSDAVGFLREAMSESMMLFRSVLNS